MTRAGATLVAIVGGFSSVGTPRWTDSHMGHNGILNRRGLRGDPEAISVSSDVNLEEDHATMTVDELRLRALALPEVIESTHFNLPSFTVRSKTFVVLQKDGFALFLMDQAHAAQLIQRENGVFEPAHRFGKPIGARAPIASLNEAAVDQALQAAWRTHAPARLRAAHPEI
jgi:hypothetical protein